MNIKQAQIVADIAVKIKDVPECDVYNSTSLDRPCCFFANGVKFGIITNKECSALAYSNKLSIEFDVNMADAYDLIFREKDNPTGQEYHDRAKVFLGKYGYGDML